MNKPRCTDTDYINVLVATPHIVSCTEGARVQPRRPDAPAHDAFTRLLHRLPPDPAALWREGEPLVDRTKGVLVGDDSTLDKPYATKMALVTRHWSGKHHAVVDGINLITLLWTDGDRLIPIDYRIYDKPNDGITKNEHLWLALADAAEDEPTGEHRLPTEAGAGNMGDCRDGNGGASGRIRADPGVPGDRHERRDGALGDE